MTQASSPYADRRRFRRIKVNIPGRIVFKTGKRPAIPVVALNLSEGGAMISCENPVLSIGEHIVLELHLNEWTPVRGRVIGSDDTEVILDGMEECEIRWSGERPNGCFGVEFLALREETRRWIQNLVALAPAEDDV